MAEMGPIEKRLDIIESSLKAIDRTLGNYIESQRGSENFGSSLEANLEDIKLSIQDQLENIVLSDDGPIQAGFRDIISSIVERIDNLEDQLRESQESMGYISPTNVAGPDYQALTEDFESQLEKADNAKKELTNKYENAVLDLERWKVEFEHAQRAREGMEIVLNDQLEAERRKSQLLFETISEMRGNLRVMCRIRPAPAATPKDDLVDFGPRENGDYSYHWGKLRIPLQRMSATGALRSETKSYEFERIFGQGDTNNDIFEQISDLAEHGVRGHKVALFCYGQTGSGKTYTLSNRGSKGNLDDGIIPRTLGHIFELADKSSSKYNFSISLSILEIYLDNIYDLLRLQEPDYQGGKTPIRLDQAKYQWVESQSKANELIDRAVEARETAATNKNDSSSRSHLIVSIQITREEILTGQVNKGLFNLVDLAGSERPAAAGLEGQQMEEGIKINKALLALNQAITALAQGTPVTWDTALMSALRPSLSRDSKTLMFVTVSPFKSDLNVTLQTLDKGQEATKAKLISSTRSTKTTRPASSTPARTPNTRPMSESAQKPGESSGSSGSRSSTMGRPSTPSRPSPLGRNSTSTSSALGGTSRSQTTRPYASNRASASTSTLTRKVPAKHRNDKEERR